MAPFPHSAHTRRDAVLRRSERKPEFGHSANEPSDNRKVRARRRKDILRGAAPPLCGGTRQVERRVENQEPSVIFFARCTTGGLATQCAGVVTKHVKNCTPHRQRRQRRRGSGGSTRRQWGTANAERASLNVSTLRAGRSEGPAQDRGALAAASGLLA